MAYAPAKPDAPYAAAPTGWAQHGVVEVTPASWAHRSDDPLAIVTTPVCESALLVVVLSHGCCVLTAESGASQGADPRGPAAPMGARV